MSFHPISSSTCSTAPISNSGLHTDSKIHLERPKAAKLKPGRKHRSPLCAIPSATISRTSPVHFIPSIKPTRPNPAYANIRSVFPLDDTARAFRPASRVELAALTVGATSTSHPSAISEDQSIALTKQIEQRFAEKIAARKSKLISNLIAADAITLTDAVTGPSINGSHVNPSGRGKSGLKSTLSNVSPDVSAPPSRVAVKSKAPVTGALNAAAHEPFKSFSVPTKSKSGGADFHDKAGKMVRSAESSGFNFEFSK